MNCLRQSINVLIKPTNGCNLRCKYCFHSETEYNSYLMSEATLKQAMKIIISKYKKVSFVWHGGEPFLAGIDYFKAAVDYQKLFKEKENVEVKNSIQTNCTVRDEKLIKFLCENKFGFGASFDGVDNAELRGGTEAFHECRNMLKNNGSNISIITVITGYNIGHLVQTYEYCKLLGLSVRFNTVARVQGNTFFEKYPLTSKEYLENMKAFFDYWIKDLECTITVNPFLEIIKGVFFNKRTLCSSSSCLGKWICIEPNGDIYPCSREFPEIYKYGNVADYVHISECFESDGFNNILSDAIARREKCINSCDYYWYCKGGCNGNALADKGISNIGGFYCETLTSLVEYIKSQIELIISENCFEAVNPTVARILANKNVSIKA